VIYDLSLQTAGLLAGAFLVFAALPGLLAPGPVREALRKLPRSRVAGWVLLTLAFGWSLWLLSTMEMGEFSGFRRPLLIALPIGFILTLRFVTEFLAVRALGILQLLAAEPLLEAAFLRYEPSRLLVTVFAYVLIFEGLFYVMMPYIMRDGIGWITRTTGRWMTMNLVMLIYGVVILYFAFTQY
jgi:uncharacterized protein YjeT (DUF2065 family)